MDEAERRLVAHEMALIEVAAHVNRDEIAAAIKAIRSGLVIGITEEERVIRIGAIELLEDALRRDDAPVMGMFLRGRGVQ